MKKGIVDDEILEDFIKDVEFNGATKLKIKLPNRFKNNEESEKSITYGVMNYEIDLDLLYNEYEYILFSNTNLSKYNILILDRIKLNDKNLLTLILSDSTTDKIIKSKDYER